MPVQVVQADTAGKEVFKVPYDKIGKITFIEVDNRSASDITITIQDVFTPFPTDETPNPSAVTRDRKKLTVKAGDDVSWEDKAKSIEILGTCKVIASVTSTDCDIVIGYEFE